MVDRTGFPALVTDYELEQDKGEHLGELPEDILFDHYYAHLDNGYVVSIMRANVDPNDPTDGFEEGKWEALLMREASPLVTWLTGYKHVPATELDHLATDTMTSPDGTQQVGYFGKLDNAGVNEVIALAAQQPRYTAEDPFEAIFESLGVDVEEAVDADE